MALERTESLILSLSMVDHFDRVLLTQPTTTVFITDDDGKSNGSFTLCLVGHIHLQRLMLTLIKAAIQ